MAVDLIDRQAAIASAISGRVRTIDGENWIRTSEVRESLKNLPTITAEPRWIPVTERLPEPYSTVLITIKTRYYDTEPWDYYTDVADYQEDGWNMFNDWDEGQEYYITAWMPLPKPWEGADE